MSICNASTPTVKTGGQSAKCAVLPHLIYNSAGGPVSQCCRIFDHTVLFTGKTYFQLWCGSPLVHTFNPSGQNTDMPLAHTFNLSDWNTDTSLIPLAGIQTHSLEILILSNNGNKVSLQKETATFESDVKMRSRQRDKSEKDLTK